MKSILLITIVSLWAFTSCSEEQMDSKPDDGATVLHEERIEEPEVDTLESKVVEEYAKKLTSVHEFWEEIKGERVEIEGVITWASQESGIPYWHSFEMVVANGDTMRFRFEGGEYEGEFIGYEGMRCIVESVSQTNNYQIALATINEKGEFSVEASPYLNEGYMDYPDIQGKYYASHESGDLPSDCYVYNSFDTLFYSEFVYEEDMKRIGEEVILYYGSEEIFKAAKVVFPNIVDNE